MWGVSEARTLAAELLSELPCRWRHVQTAGRVAEKLASQGLVNRVVVAAAWVHDVGYAQDLATTGLHALDGALFLQGAGGSTELVALVAHHTGASFEAEERGLGEVLATLPVPNAENLDALTLVDLVVGPTGSLTTPEARLDEVFRRYEAGDPVHRAVLRSRPTLLASAARARARLGLADEWPLTGAEGVLQA